MFRISLFHTEAAFSLGTFSFSNHSMIDIRHSVSFRFPTRCFDACTRSVWFTSLTTHGELQIVFFFLVIRTLKIYFLSIHKLGGFVCLCCKIRRGSGVCLSLSGSFRLARRPWGPPALPQTAGWPPPFSVE